MCWQYQIQSYCYHWSSKLVTAGAGVDNESNDDNNEDNNCNYQVIVISSIHRQCNSDTVQVVTSSVSSSDFDIFFTQSITVYGTLFYCVECPALTLYNVSISMSLLLRSKPRAWQHILSLQATGGLWGLCNERWDVGHVLLSSAALSPFLCLDYWESNSHSAPSARHLHANVNNSMTL